VTEANFDDLGSAIAPVVERLRSQATNPLSAYVERAKGQGFDFDDLDLADPRLLLDRRVHIILGETLSRGHPGFRGFYLKIEALIAAFLVQHKHPSDRNIEILTGLLKLPTPEQALLQLATAFCYGSIDRSCFSFVNSSPRLFKSLAIFCDSESADVRRIFDADRPLARSGLLEACGGRRPSRDLDDLLCLSNIGERLLSSPYVDAAEMAAAVLTPLDQRADGRRLSWPHLAQSRALLAAAMNKAVLLGDRGFNVLLHGAPGTGKTEFARDLIAQIGASGFSVDHIDGSGGEASRDDRLASLRLSQTFASQHERAVLVLDEAEDVFQTEYQHPLARVFGRPAESKAWTNNLLESNAHPVIWISNQIGHLDPAYLRRFAFCLEFPRTPHALRRAIAQEYLSPIGCTAPTVDAIAASETMTPALLASAARFGMLSAASGLGPDLAVRTLIDQYGRASGAKTPLAPRRLSRFDTRYLQVQGSTTPERLLQALRSNEPASIVFCGPPGTGKTQFAAEIATQLSRQLVVRTASDINTKWYGESEGNVARMFRDSDPKGELLFLDEAEVLLGSRSDTGHRADRAVTAEFLRWLEAYEGIFICATNHVADFDAALMRRFTFRLEFAPLDSARRGAMYSELALGWSADQGAKPPELGAATSARLSRLDQLTPGDFANVARRIRQLGLGADNWLDELEAEHATKGARGRAPIGFS
jgi:AAA+ superfamily predicted ATPase